MGRAGAKKGWTLGRGGGGEVGGRKPATTPKGGATCGTHTHTHRATHGGGRWRHKAEGVRREGSILLLSKSWEGALVVLGDVSAGLQRKLCACPELRKWLALAKPVVCTGNCVEAELPWQLRTRAQARAGNRACIPNHHAQWTEHWPHNMGKLCTMESAEQHLTPCNESSTTAQHKQPFSPEQGHM